MDGYAGRHGMAHGGTAMDGDVNPRHFAAWVAGASLLLCPHPMAYVNPENLRFTQDSIENRLEKPYDYQRIHDAVDQIRSNQLNPGVFMPLTVVDRMGRMWCLDNRRLWVLRKAGVPIMNVEWARCGNSIVVTDY
ncbi:hypothetical protein SUGI_0101800 [Cryptomeria japonica]|nr:hypothetical protein SUGI_0101800 [Cryptomeria japonica]